MNKVVTIKEHIQRGDFWLTLMESIDQAGGSISIEKLADMKVRDMVELLAPNGIRVVYRPELVSRE